MKHQGGRAQAQKDKAHHHPRVADSQLRVAAHLGGVTVPHPHTWQHWVVTKQAFTYSLLKPWEVITLGGSSI